MSGQTMFDKLWQQHVILERDDGAVLLYIDRNFVHDGGRNAFDLLERAGRRVRVPAQTFSFTDHLIPTVNQSLGVAGIELDDAREMVQRQLEYTKEYGITLFGLGDPRMGIAHVVGPEQGLTQPGLTIVCGDSHTSTHGAFGALAFGIGTSEIAHVLATQALWQRRPRTMRITVDGTLPAGVASKDIILAIIGEIGTGGATGHVIEYAGSTISALSMDERMTICNMSIEAGARAGMIAPDDTTFAYLEGRPYTPRGEAWARALAYWRALPTDPDAVFDREVHLDAADIAPVVTWGTSPEDVVPITGQVPDPEDEPNPNKRARRERALRYMDLTPGTPMTDVRIDRVFIGSCTNSRIEDLRVVAEIARGRKAVVPTMVVPGSGLIRQQAEAEGLADVFRAAGFDWREPGCSMCLGMNGETVPPGERCASTANRNFEGRQGRGSRTHLMSPAMAAAAAITGKLTDVRQLDRRA